MICAPPTILRIREIIDSPFAVAAADGQLVYEAIQRELRAGRSVRLSFAGVTVAIGAFFNAAIARLVPEFSAEKLRVLLTAEDMPPGNDMMLQSAIRNAGAYYLNSKAYDAAWVEEMSEAL
jgi:hypothetical protein